MDYPRVLHLGCPYYMGKSCNINGYDPTSSPASPSTLTSSSNAYHSNDQSRFGTAIPNRIFVGGLSSDTTEAELQSLFANYGNIIAVKIISEKSGVPKGYGFVTFETEDEARRVLKEADNLQLRGRKLNVAIAIRKSPARLDGVSLVANGPLIYPPNSVPFTFVNDGSNYGLAGEGLYPLTALNAPPNAFIYPHPTLVAQQSSLPHPCAYPKIDAFQAGQHHHSQTQVPIPSHLYHHHHQANLQPSTYPSPFHQQVSGQPAYLASGNPGAVIANPVQAMQPMPTGPWRWQSVNECIPIVNINPLFGLKQ